MKKNLKVALVGICAVIALAGCGDKKNNVETTTNTTETTTVQESSSEEGSSEEGSTEESSELETTSFTKKTDYSQYVTLGEYKGIEVPAISITDEEVENKIKDLFRAEVKDGDTVNIDYEGLLNGEAFEGGTAKGYNLTIGSNSFIDGFEEKLIGVKIGETVNLDLTFPDPYNNNPDLAGKDVVFVVTVNSIDGVEGAELNEDFVKNNTDFTTVEEYKENVKKVLKNEKENENLKTIWDIVKANATINEYPQEEVDYYADEMKNYYTQTAAMYGMDFATFLTTSNMTEEDFNTECQTYGKSATQELMILTEISRLENIVISDEDYKEEIARALEGTENTEEDLLSYYGGEEAIRETITFNKVFQFLLDNSTPV